MGIGLAAAVAGPESGTGGESPRTEASSTGLWSLQLLRNVRPPAEPTGWASNPSDGFILAALKKAGLQPGATGREAMRRLTFDLVGLPPTPEEMESFLADRSADAWERAVDRLLNSPHYGERWARHWLDVVRYADTGGFEGDYLYPGAWRYRDYVIRSLDADKPFDRFLQEQIAGDELWPRDREAVLATALYCLGPALAESAMQSTQLEYEWLTDAADTTGAAFLGLTLGCARCHDHKYDPITQKDYFALQAVFAASDRPFPEHIQLLRIKALNGLLSDAPVPKEVLKDPRCTVQTEDQVGFHLFHRQQTLDVRRLQRGELSRPREKVEAAVPVVLRSSGDGDFARVPAGGRRAVLARWLTSAKNPLTARVLVNRVWAWHFGQGIVRTPSDFGTQGEPPTHPELLDWLARDFIEHGWSLKHLHRLILLSSTYQMQSLASGRGLKVDAENRLLWHFPRRRLEGETIRDSLLACSGTLNGKQFGPPVVPPLSKEELTGLFDAGSKWPVTRDTGAHTRRSIYLLERRTFSYPMFAAFDPPEVMTSCPRRLQTVVPTQALTLLNSPLPRQQAAAFAQRLLRECGERPESIVPHAWQLAFGRPPTAKEMDRALVFIQEQITTRSGRVQNTHDSGSKTESRPLESALAELYLALFNANEFIYVD
jgi:hypothetical protein